MRRLQRAVGLLAVLTVACSHPEPAQDIEPGPADLSVENQNFPDYDIFVINEGGMRLRLGLATGHSTTKFQIPRSMVDGGAAHLYFEADPVGGFANEVGEEIIVNPGDQIELTIAPY